MNYDPFYSYYPYYNTYPISRPNLFQNIFGRIGKIKWNSVLDNTQRVLNIANQAIPMVKQITPVVRNAKTMFQVMNEFKKIDSDKPTKNTQHEPKHHPSNGPTFFA